MYTSQVDCIGALCAAAVTLSAITKVEKLYNDYDADSEVENSYNAYEYEQAGSYRAGAVLVMCAASMANIYLPVMLFVRCCCLESCVKATCNICANVFVYTVSHSYCTNITIDATYVHSATCIQST